MDDPRCQVPTDSQDSGSPKSVPVRFATVALMIRGEPGRRCAGFIQGDWIYCTREEFGAGCHRHPTTSPRAWSHRLRGKCKCGSEHNPDLVTGRSSASKSDGRKLEDQYEYRDKDGKLLYVKKRWRLPSGEKTFSYHHPGPDGRLLPGLGGRKTVLYNLPAIAAAAPGSVVYIVEGEKDVNRLKKEGKLATCNPEGASKAPTDGRQAKCKWLDRYSDDLVGFHCPVIPDNDQAGRDHARGEARSLHGKAASVKLLDLVKLMPDLNEKGDVSDFLDARRESRSARGAGRQDGGMEAIGRRATQDQSQGRSQPGRNPEADRRHCRAVQDTGW